MSEPWRDAFKQSVLRTSFQLTLTRPMLEFLSAVADDVDWDRATFGSSLAFPDNFISTSSALVKRGLIQRKPQPEIDRLRNTLSRTHEDMNSWSIYELTPAGKHVVELIKCTGMFVEADAAITKKSKRATAGAKR